MKKSIQKIILTAALVASGSAMADGFDCKGTSMDKNYEVINFKDGGAVLIVHDNMSALPNQKKVYKGTHIKETSFMKDSYEYVLLSPQFVGAELKIVKTLQPIGGGECGRAGCPPLPVITPIGPGCGRAGCDPINEFPPVINSKPFSAKLTLNGEENELECFLTL